MRDGDVVRYMSERPDRWCREGLAVTKKIGGQTRLVDTYWEMYDPWVSHVLTDDEMATAEHLFNVSDYRALTGSEERRWKEYRPEDRQEITSQHGLVRTLYVRIGSEPDVATKVQNARDDVAEAEEAVRSAESRLDGARRWLAHLEAEADS